MADLINEYVIINLNELCLGSLERPVNYHISLLMTTELSSEAETWVLSKYRFQGSYFSVDDTSHTKRSLDEWANCCDDSDEGTLSSPSGPQAAVWLIIYPLD